MLSGKKCPFSFFGVLFSIRRVRRLGSTLSIKKQKIKTKSTHKQTKLCDAPSSWSEVFFFVFFWPFSVRKTQRPCRRLRRWCKTSSKMQTSRFDDGEREKLNEFKMSLKQNSTKKKKRSQTTGLDKMRCMKEPSLLSCFPSEFACRVFPVGQELHLPFPASSSSSSPPEADHRIGVIVEKKVASVAGKQERKKSARCLNPGAFARYAKNWKIYLFPSIVCLHRCWRTNDSNFLSRWRRRRRRTVAVCGLVQPLAAFRMLSRIWPTTEGDRDCGRSLGMSDTILCDHHHHHGEMHKVLY